MTNKVYLRSSTPFSLTDRYTRQLVLQTVGIALALAVVAVLLHVTDSEIAGRMTIVAIVWSILGGGMIAMVLSSYAAIEEDALVVAPVGVGKRRYPRQKIQRVSLVAGRIAIYVNGAMVTSLPDNAAARELVQRLGHPVEGS